MPPEDSALGSDGLAQALDPTSKPLTARQAAFVREYLIDLNGTQAAIRAGYSPNCAGEVACEALKKSNVAAAVERGKALRASRVNMSADAVLTEMAALAHSSIDHYEVDDNGKVVLAEGAPENAMAAIQSVKRKKTVRETKDGDIVINYDVEIRLWDKPGSLRLMGKHAGVKAFSERIEVTGKDGGPLEMAAARLAELPPEELRAKVAELSSGDSE